MEKCKKINDKNSVGSTTLVWCDTCKEVTPHNDNMVCIKCKLVTSYIITKERYRF